MQGTFKLFNHISEELASQTLGDPLSHTYKIALVSVMPSVTDADPRFGAGGGTDLSANEVSGSGYTAGGHECPNPTVTRVGNISTVDLDDPAKFPKDLAGPNNVMAGVLYISSDPGLIALGFADYTDDNGVTPISLRDAPISPKLPNGIYDIVVNANVV